MYKILTVLFSLLAFTANSQTTYLHCGKLIDALSNNAQTEMTIIVEGTKITDVKKGYQTAAAGIKVTQNYSLSGATAAQQSISSEC